MPWFKVDDSFYDHPKVFDAPDCAVALWTRAGTWSARNLTDGFVPAKLPARLCDDPDTAIRELTDRGLWRRAKGGYQFHEWTDYQPSAEKVRDLRQKRADAGRKGGQVSKPGSKPEASASQFAKQNGTPSRPVPSRLMGTSVGEVPVGNARDSPPPRKCPKHENDPDPPPCGACREYRQAAEAAEAEAAEQAEALRLADIVRVRACSSCDAEGWAYEPGSRRPMTPFVRCTHEEPS
jgi:general stress protein YciG